MECGTIRFKINAEANNKDSIVQSKLLSLLEQVRHSTTENATEHKHLCIRLFL